MREDFRETLRISPLFRLRISRKYLFCLNLATLPPMQEMLQLQQQTPCVDQIVLRSIVNVLMTWLSWWCWWLSAPSP